MTALMQALQTTRQQHLDWCKSRALQYVEAGNLDDAFASLLSDLGKHPETEGAYDICGSVGTSMLLTGRLDTAAAMTRWINGFN